MKRKEKIKKITKYYSNVIAKLNNNFAATTIFVHCFCQIMQCFSRGYMELTKFKICRHSLLLVIRNNFPLTVCL